MNAKVRGSKEEMQNGRCDAPRDKSILRRTNRMSVSLKPRPTFAAALVHMQIPTGCVASRKTWCAYTRTGGAVECGAVDERVLSIYRWASALGFWMKILVSENMFFISSHHRLALVESQITILLCIKQRSSSKKKKQTREVLEMNKRQNTMLQTNKTLHKPADSPQREEELQRSKKRLFYRQSRHRCKK